MADKTSTVVKLVSTVAATAATMVAQKVIAAGWKSARGHKPPHAEDHEAGIGLGEVLVAAAVTGAVVAVVRVLATRTAASVTTKMISGRSQ